MVDRVVRGAHKHANARRIDVAHLGKIELNGLSGLLERQVDGIAQAIGVRDIDLAGYLGLVEIPKSMYTLLYVSRVRIVLDADLRGFAR